MSTYGYSRETTPNFSLLAKEGIFFEDAFANSTWTLPSHVSIFTGLYSYIHNVTQAYDSSLNSNLPLLPEILQKNGYETYFFAPKDEATFPGERVYNRGVTYWNTNYWDYHGKEDAYLSLALGTLITNNQKKRKTFVFFHTNLCHSPYITEDEPLVYTDRKFPSIPLKQSEISDAPFTKEYYQYLLRRMPQGFKDGDFRRAPEKIETLLANLQNASNFDAAKQIYEEAEKSKFWGEIGLDDYQEKFEYWDKIDTKNSDLVGYLKDLYDQKLHDMDRVVINTLKDTLDQGSWKKNTIVVITADHGEEFMEHGALGHETLYDDNTKIPLVFLIPGIRPASIKNNVQQVDIAPTLLDLVGIFSPYKFSGKSLVNVVRGKSLQERLLIAGGDFLFHPDLTTVRDGNWKLFISEKNGSILPYALYNTVEDANEVRDVLTGNIARVSKMIQKYKTEKESNL